MADTKISAELSAGALDGSELVEVVQSGNNRKTTTQDIANLAPGGSVAGSGTIYHLAKFTGSTTIADSNVTDDGNNIVARAAASSAPYTRAGTVYIFGGSSDGNYGYGGYAILAGGTSTGPNVAGGFAGIRGGHGTGYGYGGGVYMQGGSSDGSSGLFSSGGYVSIRAGAAGSYGSNGGVMFLYAGDAANGNGGYVHLHAGNATANDGDGGPINIVSGHGYGIGTGGNINITAGQSGATTGGGGNIYLNSGQSATGAGGHIYFTTATGATTNGNIKLSQGTGSTIVQSTYATTTFDSTGSLHHGSTALVFGESKYYDATISFVINTNGTGYTVGDILTLVGGTFTRPAKVQVSSINGGGGVTNIIGYDAGVYGNPPTNPVSVTGGTGNGFTFSPNLTFQWPTSIRPPTITTRNGSVAFVVDNIGPEIAPQVICRQGGNTNDFGIGLFGLKQRDSGTVVFTNGSAGGTVDLPQSSGGGFVLYFTFVNDQGPGTFTINATHGDTIVDNGVVGSVNGNANTSTLYSTLDMISTSPGLWIVTSKTGSWSFT